MNLLKLGFKFPDKTGPEKILFIASSPLWHATLAIKRFLEVVGDGDEVELIYNREEMLPPDYGFKTHYYSSDRLEISVFDEVTVEGLKNSKFDRVILTYTGSDIGDYRHIFRMLSALGFETCYGVNSDFDVFDFTEYLKRFVPFRLGKHIVSGCIGIHRDETEYLYELAKNGPGSGTILEIGSWTGGSSVALSLGSSDAGRGKIYAVDISFQPEYLQTLKDNNVAENVFIYQLSSQEMAVNWTYVAGKQKKIRLLWIDGDHSYNGVTRDILNWSRYIEEGGMIVLHDYNPKHPDVIRAVYELIIQSGEYSDFTVINGIFSARKQAR